MILFLSIDSSLANTGVAIGSIVDGKIKVDFIYLNTTKKSKNKSIRASSDTISRCKTTYEFIKEHIQDSMPQVIFAETPSGSQSASGMKSYGATCQLIGSLTPAPIQVTPQEVKMASIGRKTASKRNMIDWAYNKYPHLDWGWHGGRLKNDNEHMADSIGIVYAGIKTNQFNQLLALL